MKVHTDGCGALKALFRALFPPSEALLVLGSPYSTAEEIIHMEIRGGEDPGLLEVGDVVCNGRGGVEDPDPGIQFRPGIQDITNGEEGKSIDRG